MMGRAYPLSWQAAKARDQNKSVQISPFRVKDYIAFDVGDIRSCDDAIYYHVLCVHVTLELGEGNEPDVVHHLTLPRRSRFAVPAFAPVPMQPVE